MSEAGPGARPSDPSYSKAFEKLAGQDPNDVVNLLAYALYKKGLWEAARGGGTLPLRAQRDLSPSQIEILHDAARLRLQSFASAAIEQATPSIKESEASRAVAKSKGEIIAAIDNATHWGWAFLVNLGAWIFTLFLTRLIVQTYALPSVVDAVNKALRNEPARQESGAGSPR